MRSCKAVPFLVGAMVWKDSLALEVFQLTFPSPISSLGVEGQLSLFHLESFTVVHSR